MGGRRQRCSLTVELEDLAGLGFEELPTGTGGWSMPSSSGSRRNDPARSSSPVLLVRGTNIRGGCPGEVGSPERAVLARCGFKVLRHAGGEWRWVEHGRLRSTASTPDATRSPALRRVIGLMRGTLPLGVTTSVALSRRPTTRVDAKHRWRGKLQIVGAIVGIVGPVTGSLRLIT